MKSRRALFLLLALGVVAAVVVWVRAATHYSLTRKLADGTTLRIVQASFGNELSYHEPKPQAWLLAIGRRLPFATASRLGWWFKGGDWCLQRRLFGYLRLRNPFVRVPRNWNDYNFWKIGQMFLKERWPVQIVRNTFHTLSSMRLQVFWTVNLKHDCMEQCHIKHWYRMIVSANKPAGIA